MFAWLRQLQVARLSDWLEARMLRILTQPPESRLVCCGTIIIYIEILAIIDYLTGPALSLQVFCLPPILIALAWLGPSAAVVSAASSIFVHVAGDYLLGAAYTRRPTLIWNSLGFLATYMVVAWFLQSLLNLQRELEKRVALRTTALATEILAREQLQRELVEISERERRTIGNDLHDGLGQHLTAMAYAAQVLTHQLDDRNELAAKTAREIGRLAEEGILQSRQLARGLLLTAIEPAGLNRELEELAATVQRQSGVRCHYESHSPPPVRDSSTASHIFRIAQEAVRNSIRHAQPTAINLSLTGDGETLILVVSDNGPGLPATARKEAGVGLRVMAHRAKLIGAQFTLESKPGQGTHIRCRVPLTMAPNPAWVT